MTSTEVQAVKRVNDSAKKSPLKVVSPILKKYTGRRQGKIKSKLKFSRVLHGGGSKQKIKQIKPQLKTILPKTNGGNVIVLEPDLLPCALNLLKRKRKECEKESGGDNCNNQLIDEGAKCSENIHPNECSNKINKPKILSSNKKKMKCMKNLEASLELLELETSAFKERREQAFAENYLFRVQQRLKEKNENLYNQFLDLICDFETSGISVCDLFRKIKFLFSSETDLTEDFVAFLTPEQAVECGVFMDHLLLTKMSDFLNMIDVYFSKSPHQIKKIHSVLESLSTKANANTESVINSVLPLLKGNPVLQDYFVHLVPGMRPPENFFTDYEKVDYSELNSDVSDEEETMERIHLPDVEDPYGGDSCPCDCHEKKFETPGQHCLTCSLKFINGKIFIQNGKLLRAAKVVFDDRDMNYHRERLAPKLYPKRSKKKHRQTVSKDNSSPTKSANLSSDEFKSDIEDDEKGRMKSVGSKSLRTKRKKSLSPKLNLPRCNLTTESIEGLEFPFADGKPDACPQTRAEECDFLTKNEGKSDGTTISRKPFELAAALPSPAESLSPSVDVQTTFSSRNNSMETNEKNNGRSLSPPVLSIPETSDPLLKNVKPILSLLENLEANSNNSVVLSSSENAVLIGDVKLEEISNSSSKEDVGPRMKEGDKEIVLPWKIEEDRVILQTLQVEENCEETFMKIGKSIPTRSVEDIKKRFAELMNILYEMKAKTRNR